MGLEGYRSPEQPLTPQRSSTRPSRSTGLEGLRSPEQPEPLKIRAALEHGTCERRRSELSPVVHNLVVGTSDGHAGVDSVSAMGVQGGISR
jgi:hypothetical protein